VRILAGSGDFRYIHNNARGLNAAGVFRFRRAGARVSGQPACLIRGAPMTTPQSAAPTGGGVLDISASARVTAAEAQRVWQSLDDPSIRKVADWFRAAGRPVSCRTLTRWMRADWQGAATARSPTRVTPAEAQAVWDSLDNPSSRKVADWFSAAGRPIRHQTVARWKKAGWRRSSATRTPKAVTIADARAVWQRFENPTPARVAAWFKDAGRPVHPHTIRSWKRSGWPGTSALDIVKRAMAGQATIDAAAARACAVCGAAAPGASAAGAAPAEEATTAQAPCAAPDERSTMELAEETLRELFASATAMARRVRAIASGAPDDRVGTDPKAPALLLGGPDGMSRMLMAGGAVSTMAIEGLRQLGVLRAEAAAAVPGTQTVYPPGEGPHAQRSHADGPHGKRSYLSRSTLETIDQALEEFREHDAARSCASEG
jgi:hypothetical protein